MDRLSNVDVAFVYCARGIDVDSYSVIKTLVMNMKYLFIAPLYLYVGSENRLN